MNITICQPFYDHDLSSIYFDENFCKVEHMEDHYQFINYGNEKPINLLDTENYRFTKKDIIDGLLSYNSCSLEWLKDDIKDTLHMYYSKCTKNDLMDYMTTTLYSNSEIIQFMIDYLKPTFEVMAINGYSQGDRVYIVISNNLLNECSYLNHDYLQKLIYSSPVTCKIEVDECEFYHYEYMDEYEYDKAKFIDCIMYSINDFYDQNELDFIKNYLDDNLSSVVDH